MTQPAIIGSYEFYAVTGIPIIQRKHLMLHWQAHRRAVWAYLDDMRVAHDQQAEDHIMDCYCRAKRAADENLWQSMKAYIT